MAEGFTYIKFETVSESTAKDHKPVSLTTAARHNTREIPTEYGPYGRIDPARKGENIILDGPRTAIEIQAISDALAADADKPRKRKLGKNHVQAIEVCFSLQPDTTIDQQKYFDDCLRWLRVALPLPVLSAVIHRDESAPHMHVLMMPIATKDGKRQRIGGEPCKTAPKRELCKDFAEKVASKYKLKWQGAKLFGQQKRWAVDAVVARCQDRAEHDPFWPLTLVQIKRDPMPYLMALGIDINSIRPKDDAHPIPMGNETNPMGIVGTIESDAVSGGQEMQLLSCVGVASQTASNFTKKSTPETAQGQSISTETSGQRATDPAQEVRAIDSVDELWAAVGCRSMWKKPTDAERARLHQLATDRATQAHQKHSERMQAAIDAVTLASARHARTRPSRPHAAPAVRVDDCGVVRVRDEYVHECPWD